MKLKNSYFYTLRENAKDEDSTSGNLLPSFEVDKYKITCKPRLYLGFFCQYFYNFMLYTFVYHGIILLE